MFDKKNSVCGMVVASLLVFGCSRDPLKFVESGKKYIAEGKYEAGVIELKNALKINSQLPQAHYELAVAYLHLGRLAEAKQELNRTILVQPQNLQPKLRKGNRHLLDASFKNVRITPKLLLKETPLTFQAQILFGTPNQELIGLNDSFMSLNIFFELEPRVLPAYLDL